MSFTNPTDITKDVVEWLYVHNDKYPWDEIDSDKVGKWMLFPKPAQVNSVWGKIRQAVKEEHLWQAKVSTREVSKPTLSYAIMIYTKDYTDLDDVIKTLDYLESSGIKLPDWVIRYKTDQQTRAGIYSGGGQRPWIYSSDTIRLKNQNVK